MDDAVAREQHASAGALTGVTPGTRGDPPPLFDDPQLESLHRQFMLRCEALGADAALIVYTGFNAMHKSVALGTMRFSLASTTAALDLDVLRSFQELAKVQPVGCTAQAQGPPSE